MMSNIELNMKLQDNLEQYKKDMDSKKVYAASILMGLDPEEQLLDMLEKNGWGKVSPEK
jgi:hypothetical protein